MKISTLEVDVRRVWVCNCDASAITVTVCKCRGSSGFASLFQHILHVLATPRPPLSFLNLRQASLQ